MIDQTTINQKTRRMPNALRLGTEETAKTIIVDSDDYYDEEQVRPVNSAIRRVATRTSGEAGVQRVGNRASRVALPRKTTSGLLPVKRKPHVVFYIGLGMIAAVLVYFALTSLGSWWQLHEDDATYGRPRTWQTDAVVGHNDSAEHPSHFIFQNMNGKIVIVEYPGGDVTKVKVILGPQLYGQNASLMAITAHFQRDEATGKIDMIVVVEGQQGQPIIFTNDGTTFSLLKQQ